MSSDTSTASTKVLKDVWPSGHQHQEGEERHLGSRRRGPCSRRRKRRNSHRSSRHQKQSSRRPIKFPRGRLHFKYLQSKQARKGSGLNRESLSPLEQHRNMHLNKFKKVEVPAVAQHGVLGRDGRRVLHNRVGLRVLGRVGLRVIAIRVGRSGECMPALDEAHCCCAV